MTRQIPICRIDENSRLRDGGGCAYFVGLDEAKMLQCIYDGGFLVFGTNADLSLCLRYLVVALVDFDAKLVPYLGDI